MTNRIITGAIIKITATPRDGAAVELGRMQSLNIVERYAIRPIYGIGRLTPEELPYIQWSGQFTTSLYAVPLNSNILLQFPKSFNTVEEMVNELLFNEGVDIVVSRKVKQADGSIELLDFASVRGAKAQSESIDISENAIVSRSGSFIFKEPVQYTPGQAA